MAGPLRGVRVVELAGTGPAPFAAMLLADLGADVVQVQRPGGSGPIAIDAPDPLLRGRTTVEADLKDDEGRDLVRSLAADADALIEGFRPGVMERLGLGPGVLLELNPALVYGRMTGYGQDGPLAHAAGHDINYISVAGVLDAFRRDGEKPMFPLNLVGDFGGGGMLLALGVVCALLHARESGAGQVVDAAMVDGAAQLATMMHGLYTGGVWNESPGTNMLDGGAHFYEVYETADGRYVSVGAVEPQFYAELLRTLDLPADEWPQWDQARWPELKQRLAGVFRTRSQREWTRLFDEVDACVTPVLGLFEAPRHRHNLARDVFAELDGAVVPAPAPRFSATPAAFGERCTVTPAEAIQRWASTRVGERAA